MSKNGPKWEPPPVLTSRGVKVNEWVVQMTPIERLFQLLDARGVMTELGTFEVIDKVVAEIGNPWLSQEISYVDKTERSDGFVFIGEFRDAVLPWVRQQAALEQQRSK